MAGMQAQQQRRQFDFDYASAGEAGNEKRAQPICTNGDLETCNIRQSDLILAARI